MIRFRALAAAALMAAATAGTAFGDDLPSEIKVPEVTVTEAQGFYGRIDAGYAVSRHLHGASVRGYDAASDSYGSSNFDTTRFGGSNFSGGIGAGYQFNDLFRADVTGDLFRGDFNGKFASGSPCAGGAAGTGCSDKTSGSFRAGSLMANGYVDLGTLAGFTPYVGAGLGATRIDWGRIDSTASCVGCGTATSTGSSYSGQSDWRLTYALMAGVAYQVAPNVKIDLGYRYSRVAGGDMFGYSAADTAAGASGTMGRDGALVRQEVRIGLRISSW